ncbi:MAG: sugar MFS transporter [Rhodothermales bacterium]
MSSSNDGINRNKLFWGSCLALLTTAFAFTVITAIAFAVKQEFNVTNAQLGLFTGVFFIGFTVSQVIFAPFCDTIGMRWIVRFAFIGHVVGALLLLFAGSFNMAVAGSLFAGLGAGLVEAGCNPLVAALYPDDKSAKLNMFHMWFPYGNLIAALLTTFVLSQLVGDGWRGYTALILIPAVAYGIMMLFSEYPPTEGASAGISFSESLKATFAPIMLIMLPMMLLTASMELPPSSWVPSVLQSGGVDGILVFGFIFGIMGTLRLLAGPILKALTPTGVLFGGSILATIGLYLFSQADSVGMYFLTAAIWASGIALFWPTMLGYVSERNPKSGALGLGAMGAVGMLASFFVTPWLGNIADTEGHSQISAPEAMAVFETVEREWPAVAANAGVLQAELESVISSVNDVTASYAADNALPAGATAQALRSIATADIDSDVKGEASAILNPADNYGGKTSFKKLAPFGIILIIVFGFLYVRDRMSGGYKAERLVASDAKEGAAA